MEEKQDLLELPTLGRPFRLGMWYNANKNQIVPSILRWNYDDMHARPYTCPNITFNIDRTTDDSLKSKMDSLGIRGNFIISVLLNTSEVKGSGEYLNDYKTSKTHARVVLKAKGTTKDLFLPKQHFSTCQVELYDEYIERMGVTHVVVGITYGYQFFLLFDVSCDSEEEKRKVEAYIERKIVEARGGGGIRSHETREEKKLEKLKVKIHGTVQIPTNPISFQDALGIYANIPELAKGKECPMTVYLLPLASIAFSRAKVSSQIDGVVLNSITSVFEHIINSEVAISGIQTSDIAAVEPRIGQRAKKLSTMLKEHTVRLQMKLQYIMSNPSTKVKYIKAMVQNKSLIALRDSKIDKESSESSKMQEVLHVHWKSPFSNEILGIFVSKMEQEVRFMEKLVKILRGERNETNVDIISDKTDFRIPFDRSKVIVLEIPIIREEDNLLEELENFVPYNDNGSEPQNAGSTSFPFEDEKIQEKILKCVKEFVQLIHSHKTDQRKSPAKFKCIFKGYKIDAEPTIIHYNAFTGGMEPSSVPK